MVGNWRKMLNSKVQGGIPGSYISTNKISLIGGLVWKMGLSLVGWEWQRINWYLQNEGNKNHVGRCPMNATLKESPYSLYLNGNPKLLLKLAPRRYKWLWLGKASRKITYWCWQIHVELQDAWLHQKMISLIDPRKKTSVNIVPTSYVLVSKSGLQRD